jgi:concentrative nucleoside transporter, CNT family
VFDTSRWTGLIGIVVILGIALALSNNRKAINLRLVGTGLGLQIALALFILKTDIGRMIFQRLGAGITRLLSFSDKGADFVFGVLVKSETLERTLGMGTGFIFFFKIVPTIIFVAVLVSVAYHIGLMQRIVAVMARGVHALMGASGAEALSNVASVFVGQVEAQIMIKPYIATMTRSELLASMAGSMACIAGGVLAVYVALGVPAEYLIAASIMAAPGALVIAKIVYPETEPSPTRGRVKLEVHKQSANLVDAISRGASDGLRVALNVVAMLIGFIALIALVDYLLGKLGSGWVQWTGVNFAPEAGFDLSRLSLTMILGRMFSFFALVMGVPYGEIQQAGALLGQKMVINEFVAYLDLAKYIKEGTLSAKTITIVTFALCGFANFSSIAIQVGGIGELAPERRADLSRLGFRALICGTLASYLSATIAGLLM